MEIPADLKYTTEHEWLRAEGDLLRVGITDFAQDALGDVVFVQLPETGTDVVAGESFGEVESTKSVSDLFAPVNGAVTEVNSALDDAPELVNNDPYGEGWMIVIRPASAAAADALLDAEAYRALVEDESA